MLLEARDAGIPNISVERDENLLLTASDATISNTSGERMRKFTFRGEKMRKLTSSGEKCENIESQRRAMPEHILILARRLHFVTSLE